MRSVKNHLSLIIALFSIVFTMQVYLLIDRTIDTYESNLNESYSIVVVSNKKADPKSFVNLSPKIVAAEEISTKQVIEKLQ